MFCEITVPMAATSKKLDLEIQLKRHKYNLYFLTLCPAHLRYYSMNGHRRRQWVEQGEGR